MAWLRRVSLAGAIGALVAACSFPDAAIWRGAAYMEISAAQLAAGDRAGARASAEAAVSAAYEARDYEEWAAAWAAAALTRLDPDDPALQAFLADLESDEWPPKSQATALLFATIVSAAAGDAGAAAATAARLDGELAHDGELRPVFWARAVVEPRRTLADIREPAEPLPDKRRAEGLAVVASTALWHGDPDLAADILFEEWPATSGPAGDVSLADAVFAGFAIEAAALGALEAYRELVLSEVGPRRAVGWRPALAAAIAADFVRRGQTAAALSVVERFETAEERFWALAILAHRLAVEGRLAAARSHASAALALLRDSPDLADLDEEAVALAAPGVFLLSDDAFVAPAREFDPAHANLGDLTRIALFQAYAGSREAALARIATIEDRILAAAETGDGPAEEESRIWQDLARLCWFRVLIGDPAGALELAAAIGDPDVRAFARLPAAAALARQGDFADAIAVAETMVD